MSDLRAILRFYLCDRDVWLGCGCLMVTIAAVVAAAIAGTWLLGGTCEVRR